MSQLEQLMSYLQDPKKEMALVRKGIKAPTVELFLVKQDLSIKDVLVRLNIPASTYFSKKQHHQALDSYATEKFIRLISVMILALKVLGQVEAKNWLYRKIPSLGNEVPIDMLDTEVGHRLVIQALLQIQHGVYA